MQDNLQQVNEKKPPLMQLKGINMVFRKPGALLADRNIHVLKDVDLEIGEREIVALVGESGCGKTTLGKIITGLYRPTSGEVYFEGERVSGVFDKKISSYNQVQFIQQDSYAALNPARTIYQSLYYPIRKRLGMRRDLKEKIGDLLRLVELTPPEQFLKKYPHQLSGGQRQRVLLARALSMSPELIVADEPISMIDVSLRFAMLELFRRLNRELGITIIYITHDLSTARCVAQNGRMYVMYFGECVECGRTEDILSKPRHPYTQALLTAVPVPDPHIEKHKPEPPLRSLEAAHDGEGCCFKQRCLYADEACGQGKIGYCEEDGRIVLCRKAKELPQWDIANLIK